MKSNYEKLRDIRNEIFPPVLEFGVEIEGHSIGMWMHKTSQYYYKIISERNVEEDKQEDILDKVFLLRECGFQTLGNSWKPAQGFPKTIEITAYYQRKDEDKYKVKGDLHNDFKILGKPLSLQDVLLMLDKTVMYHLRLETNGRLVHPVNSKLFLSIDLNKHLSEQDEVCGEIVKLLEK